MIGPVDATIVHSILDKHHVRHSGIDTEVCAEDEFINLSITGNNCDYVLEVYPDTRRLTAFRDAYPDKTPPPQRWVVFPPENEEQPFGRDFYRLDSEALTRRAMEARALAARLEHLADAMVEIERASRRDE